MFEDVKDEGLSKIRKSYFSGATDVMGTTGKIGMGGLGDAIRYEGRTGNLLSKAGHYIKGKEQLNRLNKWIRKVESSTFGDILKRDYEYARKLQQDLIDALG